MASCEKGNVVALAAGFEVLATVLSLKIAARLAVRSEKKVLTIRTSGLAMLMESTIVLASAIAIANHPDSKDIWKVAFSFALVHCLADFELWFSRKSTGNMTKAKVLLFVGVALHFCNIGFLFSFLSGDCLTTGIGAAIAGGAGAFTFLSSPAGLIPELNSEEEEEEEEEVRATPESSKQQNSEIQEKKSSVGSTPPGPSEVPPPKIATSLPQKIEVSAPTKEVVEDTDPNSALRDNIRQKGENSYYFAHAKTPTSQNINKGESPVLLKQSRRDSVPEENKSTANLAPVRKYAFSDGSKSVSVYIDLGVLNLAGTDVSHEVEFTMTSVQVIINDAFIFKVPKLKHDILEAKTKLSSGKDRLTVLLKKKNIESAWDALS